MSLSGGQEECCRGYMGSFSWSAGFEEGVDDVLFLLHELLPFLAAIALALDINDRGVVQYPVENGVGDRHIGEDLVPLREACWM